MLLKRFPCWISILFLLISSSPAWAGNIVIKGSSAVLPIARKVAEAYMKLRPEVIISISGGGSGNGLRAIIDGTADIADSSRFIKDKEINWPSTTTSTRFLLRWPMTVSSR